MLTSCIASRTRTILTLDGVSLGEYGEESVNVLRGKLSVRPAAVAARDPPIWAATWIARVTAVTAPERLFGSRPGPTSLG
jgi:hypothetical protein